MNTPIRTLVSLIALWLIGCGGAPARPPPAPESTDLAPEPLLDADALRHLGRDTQGLMLVDDARPYLEAVWTSGFFRIFDPEAGAVDGWGWDWIPTHIALGWTDRGVHTVDRLVRLYLSAALVTAATDEACAADDAERRRALDALVEATTGLTVSGFTLGVRFRTEAQAAEVMLGVRAGADEAATNLMGALTLSPSESALDMTFAAPPLWPPEATIGALAAMGIGRAGDDMKPLAAAVAELRTTARFEQDGAWMIVRFGPRSEAPPLTPSDVELPTPAVATGRPPVIASVVELEPWKVAIQGWGDLWQAWATTATGRQLLLMDTAGDGQLLDLETLVLRAAEQGRTSATRIDVKDDGIYARMVDRDLPTAGAAPLTGDGLLRWLPANAWAIGANNQASFGRWMADALWSFEDQLARRSLGEDDEDDEDDEGDEDDEDDDDDYTHDADDDGVDAYYAEEAPDEIYEDDEDDEDAEDGVLIGYAEGDEDAEVRVVFGVVDEDEDDDDESPFSVLSGAYYSTFAALRRLILEEKVHPFTAPYAWAWTTPEGGLPQLVVVAAVEGEGRAIAYLERLLALAFEQAGGDAPATARPRWVPAELGLDDETFVLQSSAGPAGGGEVMKLDGFEPHIFEHDGVFVLSTDVGLSRQALARRHDGAPLVDGRASSAWRAEPAALMGPLLLAARVTEMAPEDRARLIAAARWFAGAGFASRFEGRNRVNETVIRIRDPARDTPPQETTPLGYGPGSGDPMSAASR